MTGDVWLWSALAVAAGAFVQGSTGMGFALIVAPVLGLLAPALLPVSLLVLMLPLNAMIAWRERRSIDLLGTRWISLGRVVGTFGGLWVLVVLPLNQLNVLIGVSTIAAVLASWLAPAFSPNRRAYVSTGVITGITETATGIGGPPLALVYQHMPVATLRASVATCFLIGELVSLLVLALNGRLQPELLQPVAGLLPALAVGLVLSQLVHRRLDARSLRRFVLLFAFTSGTLVLFQ
ncbi:MULTISPECIES: sulfite exporter TauE/SafE family protein [Oceanimonas]|uniref:sulfite exporter TauE/SafE family protein n=1 Tax=Oceanimonas TaxID=129577 RepID=UPI00037AC9FA|nr:sulfite exporter TauE/SafE family protein [Oceanimonas smirnovii]